ncbi:MAG: hypothetical protein ACOYJE_01295 [Bacteroidaceae bacterium]|jgi:hypothetical protein
MTKKLHHYSEEEQARAFSASNDPTVGAKGTKDNPYSQEEFEAALEAGTWGGGYVGDEYIPAETTLPGVTITPSGSSSYGGDRNKGTSSENVFTLGDDNRLSGSTKYDPKHNYIVVTVRPNKK